MNFWLAPLHGITNYHFRNCLARHTQGISTAITPFLPVQSHERLNVKKWNDILPENNTCFFTIPQLIGNAPSHFVDTIVELQQFGYQHFNWNIGCPAQQVVRKQRGCGLMPFPEKVEEVVEKVLTHTHCGFSVKMRLGMYSIEESYQIIQRLNNYPLDNIIVHPRLGIQQYEGIPDHHYFHQVMELSKNQVIYSGDIFDGSSYQKLRQHFPKLETVLLGRGILRNIFLAEELTNEITIEENRYHRFSDFYNDLSVTLLSYRSKNGALSQMKELWHYFCVFFSLPPEELQKILRINSWREFDGYIQELIRKSLTVNYLF